MLIAKGVIAGFPPIAGQRSGVIEVDPNTDEVVWRMDFDDPAGSLFRAQRYPGCALFQSVKHCPEVASS